MSQKKEHGQNWGEGELGGCWGVILFPYLLGLSLGGALRCLMQMPPLGAKAALAGRVLAMG